MKAIMPSVGEGSNLGHGLRVETLRIAVSDVSVSAIFIRPPNAQALYLFAHGAGAGITHKAMESNALGLAARGIATLRFQFPYMEKGSRRPDPPRIAHEAVRAAVGEAAKLAGELPLFAGGRSFGGRMTSQAQALAPLPDVRGLVFLGFPLHPAGKPATARAEHLFQIEVPMLFVSGARDALAEKELLASVVARLGEWGSIHWILDADHGLKVPLKSGRTTSEAEAEALDAIAQWIGRST